MKTGTKHTATSREKMCGNQNALGAQHPLFGAQIGAETRFGQPRGHRSWVGHRALGSHGSWLLRTFGLQPEDIAQMLERQGGVCAICKKPESRTVKGRVSKLAVDHNHKTGKVRGLLCYRCNTGIGMLQDDPQLARAAVEYLETP